MYKKDQHDRIGLLCFSTNWKSPLLWSHYAEKHRGLCLGFDLRASTMQAVKYEDQRLRVEMGAQDGDAVKIPGELKALLLKTKARCWEYEGETRRFIRLSEAELDNQLYFWPFSDDMRLIEVIIGSECRRLPSEIERITNSVNPGIYVSKARLAWRSFTIVPDGKHLSSKLT